MICGQKPPLAQRRAHKRASWERHATEGCSPLYRADYPRVGQCLPPSVCGAQGIGSRIAELSSKASHNDNSGFFTPTFDSPCAGGDSVADFAVGVFIGKFIDSAKGDGTVVRMAVDEEGGDREAQLVLKQAKI